MGFLRKGLFVATGGLSGAAGVKANSKKERTAKALERQNRQSQERPGGLLGALMAREEPAPADPEVIADALTKLVALRDQGVLTSEEFEAQKRRLLGGETEPGPRGLPRPRPQERRPRGLRNGAPAPATSARWRPKGQPRPSARRDDRPARNHDRR